MVYYEIIVKKEDAPLHVDFKYKETVSGVDAREKAQKKMEKQRVNKHASISRRDVS